ncbi:MAG: triose-phosphate isomerase [Alphaproteobacteria bacterium]|nr:triose-phosphate isomerase [Alphaproteobacteria bacterium]
MKIIAGNWKMNGSRDSLVEMVAGLQKVETNNTVILCVPYTMLGAGIGRKCFASAVVGGYGNMYGAIVGGLIIGVAETMIAGYVSSMYKDMFTYLILLIFLFVKPTGIFNEKTIQE